MKKISRRSFLMATGVIAASAALSACGGSSASTSSAGSTAASTAASAPAAQGGGDLVIYSPNSEGLLNATIPLFEEKYGVNVELIQAGTGELVKRIQSEKNDPYADVLFGGSWSLMYTNEDLWEPYVSVNDANVIDAYKNKCGFITGNVLDGSVLIVNTDLIGDIKIEGYADLLNPELKGKIASADPTASSSAMMHIETILTDFGGLTLENEEGWNVVSELIKNLDGKLASGSSSAWKSVADGEMTVVLTYEEAGIALARSGANIAIVYPEEGTVLTPSTVGLIKNCNHPENGKLFIDFVLSQEVQNILCNELDVRPVRDDVSYPDYFRPASDIKTVDLDQEYVNQHKTDIVDKFTEVYQGTF